MDSAEWQKRLVDNFSAKGRVGGNLSPIIELEKTCGVLFAHTFKGQLLLIDSFQTFS